MKTKILSLVVVLSVLLSLGIVAPVSATSTTGAQINTVTSAITCEDDVCCDCEPEIADTYDTCYVSLDGDDENDEGVEKQEHPALRVLVQPFQGFTHTAPRGGLKE